MNNHIQLVLKSSTTEMSLNDHESGIYLVPEIDGLVGLPNIRTTSGVNAGYDGGWTSAQNFDARSITIRGVIANTDVAAVESMRKRLISLLAQGKSEQLTLNLVTEAGNAYELEVRTIACEMAMQTVLTQQQFMIQLRADDPLIYDGSATGESVIVQVQQAIGGFEINFQLPLAISGGEGESVIQNEGLEQVYPVIKMYGALHNPTFVNLTTSQQIQVDATLGYAEGEWSTPSDVYEGKAITIDDAPAEAPLASFQLKGETSQNGTPTPDAPVAVNTTTGENVVQICGKNILNTDNTVGEQTQSGFTASMSGSVVSIDGEGTGADGSTSGMNRTWALTTQIPLAAGTYSLSGTLLSGSWTAAAQSRLRSIRINLSSGTYKEVSASNGSTTLTGNTFTLTEATNVVSVQIMVYGQVKFYDAEFGLQLELGSTATTYEPYQSQSYEVNLGKNLYDKDSADYNVYLGTESVVVNAQGNGWSIAIPVEVGQTYTFSKQFTTGQASDVNYAFIGSTPAAGVAYIGGRQSLGTGTTFTATAPTGAKYLIIYYTWNATAAQKTDAKATFQIEKGSTATSYANYFTPIELCKIGDYQDYIYKSDGKWYKHKEVGKYTFTSSETISYQSNFPRFMVNFSHGQNATTGVAALAKSTHFVVGQTASVDGTFGIAANVIYLHNNAITSIDDLKTWFGNNNVSVYYALATPTDTEITNEALIKQLEAVLGGHTYAGTNNIFTITPNEQGTLEISYMTEKSQNRRDVIVIDSRMRTVTLNGADVYHLIAEGSEFPLLAPGENKLVLHSDITGDNGYAEVNYKQGYLSI